jgi:hypothetical protein
VFIISGINVCLQLPNQFRFVELIVYFLRHGYSPLYFCFIISFPFKKNCA